MTIFGAIRPGCWLNLISANGLLLFPEASSGCTCSFPLRSTVVMKHKELKRPRDWTVFITHGDMTPVKRFSINLGAPGDMKDDEGTLWFGYPRPRIGYGVKFSLNEQFIQNMGYFCQDFKGVSVARSDNPWLFTSGGLGLLKLNIPLISDVWGQDAGVYTVRLGFMATSGDRKGERVFDVKLQDKAVMRRFDILKTAGAPNRAVIKEFSGIKVNDNLVVELVPQALNPTITQAPMINFIEIIREDADKVSVEERRAVPPLEKGDAEAMLKAAQGNRQKALEAYHTVLDAAFELELKIQALEGIKAIGSQESLSKIAKYSRGVSPILWNYDPPDPELTNKAIEAYAAIAVNTAKIDKEKAVKMLKYALTITSGLGLHQQVIVDLESFGMEVDTDAAKAGFITHWHLIGPFPRSAEAGWTDSLDEICVGEPSVNLSESYKVGDTSLTWEKYVCEQERNALEKLFTPNTNVSAYAYAEFILPEEQDLLLKIGSDDSFKCWFNGEVAGRFEGNRTWAADQSILKVKGKKGVNAVLLKISQADAEWAFSAKLTDVNNTPVRCEAK